MIEASAPQQNSKGLPTGNAGVAASAEVEAFKWNACCAALRAAIQKYIKTRFTTATAGEAERELLEVATIFYKDAGQNLLDRIALLEAKLAAATLNSQVGTPATETRPAE